MTDEHLLQLSTKIDTFLIDSATEFETPALALSAVILARLLILNTETDSAQDLRALLSAVSEAPLLKVATQSLH